MTEHELLLKCLHYDPLTGVFVRVWSRYKLKKIGAALTRVNDEGYVIISFNRRQYKAHRLAVFYMTGEWPEHEVDHDDRCRSNNRWANLVPATHAQNHQNRKVRSDSKSGLIGARWHHPTGRWQGSICVGGKPKSLGMFATAEEAHAAYVEAKKSYHPFHPIFTDHAAA